MAAPALSTPRSEAHVGVLYAVAAFGTWGVVPLYWALLHDVAPLEVVAHRVVWSTLLLLAVAGRAGALGEAWRVATDRRRAPWFALSALLLGANWTVYIGAVHAERVVEASLGYFINPLVNVLLGALVLRERLRRAQWVSVTLAALGVVVLAVRAGVVPWLGLALALSFGLYGLVRKQAPAGALVGSVVEVTLMAVPGAAWLLALGGGALATAPLSTDLLLLGTSVVTAAPLLWFAEAARRLPLSTLGFAQYLAPFGQLAVGVLLLGEPFDPARAQGFLLIWVALAVFTWDARRGRPAHA